MLFTIVGKKLSTGEEKEFTYDNLTNTLSDATGIFAYPDKQPKPMSRNGFPSMKKSNVITLLKIQLGLTCNYSCEYCSQRFVERPPETSKRDIDTFIERLAALDMTNLQRVEFWGGEPLVYIKTLKPLLARMRELVGDSVSFNMITNGSLITREIADWLIESGLNISISHDAKGQAVRGPDPLLDDPVASEAIKYLYGRLRPLNRISFNSMLTNSNISRREIHQWFVDFTGDETVPLGEGTIIDSYDDGGAAMSLRSKSDMFKFRKTAFKDIYETNGQIGFNNIIQKLDDFTTSILSRTTTDGLGQKCGMDREDVIAIDLHGNIVTCQNVSITETAPNGASHHLGNIVDMSNINISSATHWKDRPHCSGCPVLMLCKGSCMFLQGENWHLSCDNAYSDNIALLALSFERITEGFVPVLIKGGDLPDHRRDIWGDILPHKESIKTIPIKVVA